MISLNNIADIPSGSQVIVDTNIFVYLTAPHPRYGISSRDLVNRVESGDIQGYIPHPIAYEILHRLMIEEIVKLGYADDGISAVRYLKRYPKIISSLSLAYDVFSVLRSIGFHLVPDSPETPDRTFHLSRSCQLMAKDASIAAIAQEAGITNIATNDNDFCRVPFLKMWRP